jgi:hypothetical protein
MTHYRGLAAAPFRSRPDISPDLLHLTRGETREAALAVLRNIVAERRLRGGTGFIRGGFRCVCFTEAPTGQLRDVFRWSAAKNLRLQPCGILLGKSYLYALGGRPVIYQAEAEYDHLPDSMKYRHVRYDPLADPPIDFTWEREWRLHADALQLEPERCCIVVAHAKDRAALLTDHARREARRTDGLAAAVGELLAMQYVEDFPWPIIELGV